MDHHRGRCIVTAILASGIYAPAVAASVSITDKTVFAASRGTASVSYSISNDGTVRNQNNATLEAWLHGMGGSVGDYEVRATVVSGSLTAGTTGSWLNCGTTRTWTLTNSAVDNSTITAVLTIEIRLASSGVVQDSAAVTLSAESRDFDTGGRGGFQ
jgi:hypothetical protein